MSRCTFAISFYINRGKTKQCKHPIYMRISVNGTNTSIMVGEYVESTHWNVKENRVNPQAKDARRINRELDNLNSKAQHHYEHIKSEQGVMNAAMIKMAIKRPIESITLLKLMLQHNEDYGKRIGKDRCLSSLTQYENNYATIKEFIRLRFNKGDMSLHELDLSFVNDLDFYLRVTKRLSPCTVKDKIIRLRKIVFLAINKGLLDRDPFTAYVYERVKRKPKYLSEEDLQKIMSLEIEERSICQTRDLFVFSAFTGLSLNDVRTLEARHISHSSDGTKWVFKKRENTKVDSKVMLLNIPRQIILKYRHLQRKGRVFNMPTMQTLSIHLKEIGKRCELEHRLCFKMARPCFARIVTLPNGVPVETVSRMMGYSSAERAQQFINVTRRKIGKDMAILSEKIEKLYRSKSSLSQLCGNCQSDENNQSEKR